MLGKALQEEGAACTSTLRQKRIGAFAEENRRPCGWKEERERETSGKEPDHGGGRGAHGGAGFNSKCNKK